jgi:hypothetical protein
VYWQGAVPGRIRDLTGGLGVPVRFLTARYTARELLAEATRLAADPRVRTIGPEVDGSGLTVTVTRTGTGTDGPAAAGGILATAKVPLHRSRQGTGAQPQFAARDNDFAPYWGGGRYTTPVGGCTTGFAIFWQGLDHMLSAGHCGSNGQLAVDGGGVPGVDTMGNIFNDNDSRDTLMINTPSEGNTYVGSSLSFTGMNVDGAVSDFVGNYVCTSGSRTGEHCGVQVLGVNEFFLGRFPMTRAAHPTGCAVDHGDSGGPVYHYGGTGVVGRGTITGGWFPSADCSGFGGTSSGSRFVWYAPLLRPWGDVAIGTLQFYGAAIL